MSWQPRRLPRLRISCLALRHLLDVQAISDISGVVSEDTFKRPIYAGNLIATVQSSDAIKVLTVRGTAFRCERQREGGSASIEAVASAHDSAKSSFIGEEVAVSDRPELTAADIVISGGRGMGNGENFDMLYSLRTSLGAQWVLSRGCRCWFRAQ